MIGRVGVVRYELGAARVEGHDTVAEKGVGAEATCDTDENAQDALAGRDAAYLWWGADCVHCED